MCRRMQRCVLELPIISRLQTPACLSMGLLTSSLFRLTRGQLRSDTELLSWQASTWGCRACCDCLSACCVAVKVLSLRSNTLHFHHAADWGTRNAWGCQTTG